MIERLSGLEFLKKNEIKDKTCDMNRPFAFISYSHDEHDTQIVLNVFHALYNRGYNLWIDIANMPHDEHAWTRSALTALRTPTCKFAFFFRSESSMAKPTIAKELETIKKLRHIGDIVTLDIWHEENNTAESVYDQILNDVEDTVSFDACERICNIVHVANSAIRLGADVQNDVKRLTGAMAEELEGRGVHGGIIPPGPPDPNGPEIKGDFTLPDFFKEYNISTFRKDKFYKVALIGQGACARYNTPFFDSASSLTWHFVQTVLKVHGYDYISLVLKKYPGLKNPPFITAQEHQVRIARKDSVKYRQLEVPGLESWSMCAHYGQYNWFGDVLRKRILDLGFSLEMFSFQFIAPGDPEPEPEPDPDPKPDTTGDESGGGITGPVDLGGKNGRGPKLAPDRYSFTLYGTRYEDQKLKNLMLTVFTQTLDRHPDKLNALVNGLPCLAWGGLEEASDNSSTFRAGMTREINGMTVAIGSPLGRNQVFNYIGRLMRMCAEPKENLVIDGYNY